MVPEEIGAQLGRFLKGEIRLFEPLRLHTTWRIGGDAQVFVIPADPQDLVNTCLFAKQTNTPCHVIGNGSNLLAADEGVLGIVVKIGQNLGDIKVAESKIISGAGVLLPRIAATAAQNGLGGLEFAAGIPASVGGATAMNAGAYGQDMAGVVEKVRVLNASGQISVLNASELDYGYRTSRIKQEGLIVFEVTFSCKPGEPEVIHSKIKANLEARKKGQPLHLPNAGSIFKNPQGQSAGRLIELAGGKGMRVGDAEVSSLHANFIVNMGEAKASDVLKLIKQVQSLVEEKFSLRLELEIQVLGV